MALTEAFEAHLASGITTLARCWALTRRDARVFGFTDHDRDIAFDGMTFKADTGLTARALQQTTGLSVDNSEALGALSDASVTETDIRAGRFDGATVEAWLVNWAAPDERMLQFKGTLGEIARVAGAFRAEFLGLSEAMNRLQGQIFQTPCAAVVGDHRCRVDLEAAAFSGDAIVETVEDQKVFALSGAENFADGWFERGRLIVTSGTASGLSGVVKKDALNGAFHIVELWGELRAEILPGDSVRLTAGCDKTQKTCRLKFDNILNYRGFPTIPGEERALSLPVRVGGVSQGSGK